MASFYNTTSGGGSNDFYSSQGFGQPQQGQQQQAQQQPGGYGYGADPHQQQQPWNPNQQQQQQQPYQQPYGSQQPYGYGNMTNTNSQFPVQQQQQQQPVNFWNPAAAATMAAVAGSMAGGSGIANEIIAGTMAGGGGISNEAMFKIGDSIFKNSTARMVPGLESTLLTLRAYFAVDNEYVLKKMKKILFPYLSKQWRRQEIKENGRSRYDLPIVDENAPDLYLPSMTLITYVLLCALCYGTAGQFNPEVIPDVTTRCFVTQLLEVLVIRFGIYMMQVPIAFLDLFSYTGYKYLGLCLNMLFGLLVSHFGFGTMGYYVTFLYTASAMSFFMLKTMANNIPTRTAAGGPKREAVVLACAASQFVTMWFVSQTKFL